MSRRKKNFLLRELEFFFADLRLWWQKRRDRSNVHKAAKKFLTRPEGADAVVEEVDEEGHLVVRSLAEPARAVSKWKSRRARTLRIAVWKVFRPVLRWRVRHPFLAGLLVWGPVLAASGLLTHSFIKKASEPSGSRSALSQMAEEADPELGEVRMTFSGPPASSLSIVGNLPAGVTPGQLMRRADLAFLKENYPEAEELYRQALPFQKRKPLVLFKIFVSVLLQNRTEDAKGMLSLIPPPPLGASPANFYARAALAIHEGNRAEAHSLIQEARSRFPVISGDYETVMKDAGVEPPSQP